MKVCKTCLERLPKEAFYKCSSYKDGLRSSCKPCTISTTRKYREANKSFYKQYYKNYRKVHRSKVQEYSRNHYRLNKGSYAESTARRKAAKIRATPVWVTKEHLKEIEDKYWLARDISLVTEGRYHVDHIVPLQSPFVCGLHVPWNLQILPGDINHAK